MLTGISTPDQSEPESNDKEGELYNPQISSAGASFYHSQETLFGGGGSYPSTNDTVSIF